MLTNVTQEERLIEFRSVGTYSFALGSIYLERRYESYVHQFVWLSALFVSTAYAGMWIDAAAVPARVALSIIAILIINQISTSAREQLPPISYSAWLTDFIYGSLTFTVIAFWEMAAVNFGRRFDAHCAKRAAAAGVYTESDARDVEANPAPKSPEATRLLPPPRVASLRRMAVKSLRSMKDMDYHMRWLFPIAYLGFCIGMVAVIGEYPPSTAYAKDAGALFSAQAAEN